MKKTTIILIVLFIASVFMYLRKTQNTNLKEEKVIYMGLNEMPSTLDPSIATDHYAAMEIMKVYEGLYEYHYLKRPAELIPNLAENMPEISPDGMVYTFKIKKGVYFQDNKCFNNQKGRELTARDFVYSIMRCANPKLQSPLYAMIDGKILGLAEWRDKYKDEKEVDYTEKVAGLEIIDDYTLKITLARPWSQFLNMLAMPFLVAIPKEAVEYYGKEFCNNPVGTGPFIIQTFSPQQNKVIAVKNLNYRVKYYPTEASKELEHLLLKEQKRIPFVDRIETSIMKEEQPMWLNFINKKLDIIDLNGMSDLNKKIKNNEPVEEYKNKGILLMISPSPNTSLIAMNSNVKPFKDNLKLRRAMSMAYDREEHNRIFNDNYGIIAQSFIPPDFAGHQKDFINQNNTYDLNAAKALLKEAGYPEGKGLEIVLDTTANPRGRQLAEFFQNCMNKIGIKVSVSFCSWPELVSKMHGGKTQMHTVAWGADYPDAENFLGLYISGDPSYGVYDSKQYKELFKKASVMKDSPERTKLYEEMNRMLAADVPALYLMHSTSKHFYYDWILNFEYFDPARYTIIQYIDINLEKKKARLKS